MAVLGGRLSEDFPESGAIFMSNRITKDECFDKRVFGLPFSSANFVKNVKAGMFLFLFEYEERNLYGVFKATSDGRMNIIPKAYRSSGMYFPAQVRFCVVQGCRPLSENCFRDAIRDNYYAPNKFRFGLSKEQVRKLLLLFDCSRSRVQKPLVFENLKRRSIKSSDRTIDFATEFTAKISENSSSGSQLIQLQRGLDQCRSTSNNSLLQRGLDQCRSPAVNPGIPVKQADSKFTSKHGFTAQISKDSSSGSLLIQLQTGPECNNTPNDSLLLGDYIPLSDPEHCDSVNSGDGNDQSDSELHPKVKRLYSDTQQKRRSVFSRLQCGSQEWGDNSHKNRNYPSHTKWDSESSSFEQESERKSGAPQSGHRIMKKLERRREKRMPEDITPSQKTDVFSRLSFPPDVPMYDREREANSLSKLNTNESAKKRSHQVPIPDHSDGKNISMSIQVEMLGNAERVAVNLKDSSSPVNVKLASHHLDFNHIHERRTLKTLNVIEEMDCRQVFKEPFPEDQHKRKTLMRSTGSDFSNRIMAAPCPVASKGGTKTGSRLRD